MMIETLSNALAERGYDTLTEVQEAVSAPELQDSDLLVSAQTGSGKTVGFGLAMARNLLEEDGQFGPAASPMALIIAPTRELALQVMRELSWLYSKAKVRVASCVGGMDMRQERRNLDRGAHIVVGTPGRLRDHIQRGSLDMDHLRVIVLDEADEMLDLGFRDDLEFMLGEAPDGRRTLMFSATVPASIAKLAAKFQKDAVRVSTVSGAKQHVDITYQALRVAARDTENAIFNLLRFHDADNAIVFGNTRAAVNHLTARLANRGFAVVCLSGELSQAERTHALQAMRDGRAKVCVATDVAARGIDLPGLDLVIHADLPTNAEGLLHRSGRTGRAGRKGISALIVPPKLTKKAERLLKFAKIQAVWQEAPDADEIKRRDEERLLNDPTWGEEASVEEAGFAERLLEKHSAEAIAAAYLRLYRSGRSAPEELASPGAMPSPSDHKSFGPSGWFSLSVGREERAEPRWILPLLLRATDIEKGAIGAIRVQETETFIEIAERAVPELQELIQKGLELEKGIKMKSVHGTPDLSKPSGRPPRPPRDFDKSKKPRREEKGDFDTRPPRKAYDPAKSYDPDAPKAKKPFEKRDNGTFEADKPKAKFERPKGPPPPQGKKNSKKAKARAAAAATTGDAKPHTPRNTDPDRKKPGGAKPRKRYEKSAKAGGKAGGKPGGQFPKRKKPG